MSTKPATASGYSPDYTLDCERTLVTLLRGFGTFKDSLRLVGGLVPRYLTPARPPHVPEHAGTMDVDLVLNIQLLARGEGYKTLAEQLKARGFERALNAEGRPTSWRWCRQISENRYVVVDFLRDAEDEMPGGGVFTIDGEKISALAVPYAGIVHDCYEERDITAELLDGAGTVTERVRYADRVGFIVLKAIAFDQRHENKDAGDLIHVLRYAGELEETAEQFRKRLAETKHDKAIEAALAALQVRFCGNNEVEAHLRDGPVAYARFMHGLLPAQEEARVLAQRTAGGLVMEFLQMIGI